MFLLSENKYIEVNVIKNTDRYPVPDGYSDWLTWWDKMNGEDSIVCSCKDCRKYSINGILVVNPHRNDDRSIRRNRECIIPLCIECSKKAGLITVLSKNLIPIKQLGCQPSDIMEHVSDDETVERN